MWVQDVRLPPQPAVPVVATPDDQMSATLSAHTPADALYRRTGPQGRRRAADRFTPGDIDLIHAVTGESVWSDDDATLSPFAARIAGDRRRGVLAAGREADARYLLGTGRALAEAGRPNPFSGVALDRALAHLALGGQGRVDVSC